MNAGLFAGTLRETYRIPAGPSRLSPKFPSVRGNFPPETSAGRFPRNVTAKRNFRRNSLQYMVVCLIHTNGLASLLTLTSNANVKAETLPHKRVISLFSSHVLRVFVSVPSTPLCPCPTATNLSSTRYRKSENGRYTNSRQGVSIDTASWEGVYLVASELVSLSSPPSSRPFALGGVIHRVETPPLGCLLTAEIICNRRVSVQIRYYYRLSLPTAPSATIMPVRDENMLRSTEATLTAPTLNCCNTTNRIRRSLWPGPAHETIHHLVRRSSPRCPLE